MKAYLFGIGVLLMLAFCLAGLTFTAALMLRRVSVGGPLTSIAIGTVSLIALIAALAWSVPPRG